MDAQSGDEESVGEADETSTEETSTEETTEEEGSTTEEGIGDGEKATSVDGEEDKVEKSESTEVEGETKVEPKPKEEEVDEYGLKAKVNGKENRIPYPKTRKIIDNQLGKGYRAIEKVLGIETGKITNQTLETMVGESLKDIPNMRARIQGFDELEPIMRDDPDAFVQGLAETNPKYKKFLVVLEPGFDPAKREGASTFPAEKDDPMPVPDIDLGDGRKTYSEDGWQKREEWNARKMQRQFDKTLSEKFKPLDDAHKANQTKEEYEKALDTRIKTTLHYAEKWEGFKENETEIRAGLTEFAAIPQLEFRVMASYAKTMMSKLKVDRQKMRDEILAEMKKNTTTSTSTPETTKVVPKKDETKRAPGEGSTSVIRTALNKAKASGRV